MTHHDFSFNQKEQENYLHGRCHRFVAAAKLAYPQWQIFGLFSYRLTPLAYYPCLDHEQIRLLGDVAKDWTWTQGFVDNKGKFVTREEALIIAEEAGQRFWDPVRHEQLFSENLY